MTEVILTGLRTNSDYHLGNYLGAILPMKQLIDSKLSGEAGDYQVNLFAPNLHSFTTPIDFANLHPQTWTNLKLMVAAGIPIDHPRVHLYRQSAISAHSELAWILFNFTGFGELSRMVEFKQKSQQVGNDRISLGLFSYPVLMAADILLYDARWVPVGDDQRQHLELTRDLASRFNQQFGQEVFQVPASIDKQQKFVGHSEPVRIRNLRRPESKMSKSDQDPAGTINLNDSPDEVASKIKASPTDTVGIINYDWDNQPAISNLLSILSHLTDETIDSVTSQWSGQTSYRALKEAVIEVVNQSLGKIQANIDAVSDKQLEDHLLRSEATLRVVADKKLAAVQRLIGLRGASEISLKPMLVHQVVEPEIRQRADQLAGRHWPQLSRARIKQLAKTGRLKFDGLPVNAGYRCRQLGQLSLDCPDPRQQPIPVLQLPIIYQDEAVIVINKPAGVISHARGRHWDEPSVASSLRSLVARDWESPARTGLAHRLDRATSGLMVIAKTSEDLKVLQQQFTDRTVSKTYRALIDNSPASQSLPNEGLIDRPIDRSPKAGNKFCVSLNGKPAQTKWRKQLLKSKDRYVSLNLEPLTGRTHQLRVHLASLGCPIIGDKLYGGSIGPRLALHSHQLSFDHPRTGQRQTFVAPLPSWLQKEALLT